MVVTVAARARRRVVVVNMLDGKVL